MCILPGLLHFTSKYGFPKLNAVILIDQEFSVGLERGTRTVQFDVCCEAIHQNFDCGCVLKKGYANLKLPVSANPNQKITIQKIWNYWQSSLRATEKYVYCLSYLPKYGVPKLNATYHFYIKSG